MNYEDHLVRKETANGLNYSVSPPSRRSNNSPSRIDLRNNSVIIEDEEHLEQTGRNLDFK
jgi:hypothetical protein